MATAGKIVVGIVKWIVIPAGLGVAGYHLIGPQFTKVAPSVTEKVTGALASTSPAAPADESTSNRKFSAPKVEITVSDPSPQPRRTRSSRRERVDTTPVDVPGRDATDEPAEPKPKKRRTKAADASPKPAQDAPQQDPTNGDEAGSGGAAGTPPKDAQGEGF